MMKRSLRITLKRWASLPMIQPLILFFGVFGPATITAMADNDAGGVATYSVAGATLGYPVLFILLIITILLGVTQEMGMRLTLVTRRGLADLIREKFGIKVSLLIFAALVIANLGTITTELAAVKVTSGMLKLPAIPFVILIVLISGIVVTKGNYKLTQGIMLITSLFYLAYIISAVKSQPDWGLAISNIFWPHGVDFTPAYMRNYLLIGMGVLGTTITPWGQFFISSFAYDKNIEAGKIIYSQLETYVGAFLTDFFSFFMIVATAATLFAHKIALTSGEEAALAIQPFAGKLAGTLFAFGILNAGFMGLIVVSLSTAYAFAEFFGLQGSLDSNYKQSKSFYLIFIAQLVVATIIVMFPGVSFFKLAITTQTINAIALPLVFYYLIKLAGDRGLMGKYTNTGFQKWFTIIGTIAIFIASVLVLGATFFPKIGL
jgi:Mn2+/Fe2+ NRAMP family transporter